MRPALPRATRAPLVTLATAALLALLALPVATLAAQERAGQSARRAAPASAPDACADSTAKPDARVSACRARVKKAAADPAAREALGLALMGAEKYRDAQKELEQAVKLAPARLTAWDALADAYFYDDQHDIGHKALYRMLGANPDSVRAHVMVARAYFSDDAYDTALVHVDHAVKRAPKDADLHDLRGDALHGLERVDDALAAYREAVRLDSTHRNGHLGVAMILRERKQHAEAIRHYDVVLAQGASDQWIVRQKAEALVQLERPDEGVKVMEALVKAEPANDEAHYQLADFLVELDRAQAALPHYREAIRLDTADATNRHDLGVALLRLEQPDSALAHFRAALRLQPRFRMARANTFDVLVRLQRMDEALAFSDEWAKASSDTDADPPAARGMALRLMDRQPEALAALDQAIVRDSTHFSALVNRGIVLLGQQQLDRADLDARTIMRIAPDRINGFALAGFVALAREKCDDVVMHWAEVLRMEPKWMDDNDQIKGAYESCIHQLGTKK